MKRDAATTMTLLGLGATTLGAIVTTGFLTANLAPLEVEMELLAAPFWPDFLSVNGARGLQQVLFVSAMLILLLGGHRRGVFPAAAATVILSGWHLYVLQVFALGWLHVGVTCLCLSLAWCWWPRSSASRRIPPATVLILAAFVTITAFPLLSVALWLGSDGWCYLLIGQPGAAAPGASSAPSLLWDSVLGAPSAAWQLATDLIAAYGLPVRALGLLQGKTTSWFNPVLVAWATILLFHGPAMLMADKLAARRRSRLLTPQSHKGALAQTFVLLGLWGFRCAYPDSPSNAALIAMAYPLFVFSLCWILARRPTAQPGDRGGTANLVFGMALACVWLGSLLDTIVGWSLD
jgi:hypothetical protein